MIRLDELIKELCPNGVEKKRISDICTITRGKVMSKDYINDNPGDYPVYSSQTENNGELGRISTYEYDGEYLTWTTDGANAGTVFYRRGRFSVTNVCGLLKVVDEMVVAKYLYYVLSTEAPLHVNRGMGNPKLMSNVMAGIKVFVPPLEIQEEIVKILDKFTDYVTELQAELQTELQARRQQYEYYRYKLLVNDTANKSNIKWMKLKEVATISRGKRVVKKQLAENGEYPVYQNCLAPMGYFHDFNCDSDTTYVISAGAAGEIGYSYGKFWAADDCLVVSNLTAVNNRFIYYYLLTQQSYIKANVRTASIPRLSKSIIENLEIPMLSILDQKKIVDILDRFDMLCNDISDGLPAEIEARQRQYEYYRDKLLAFKELEVQ